MIGVIIMAKYRDFIFEKGEYDKVSEYTDASAIVLAIRNILLSRPGNFPFNPSIGMDIRKYQFDLLDTQTLSDIKSELNRSIAAYIPELEGVNVSVEKIEKDGKSYLGISVSVDYDKDSLTTNFLLVNEKDDVRVFNEIY